jgi:hypothetical protein
MRIEEIIRMINNKEYKRIDKIEEPIGYWYVVELENGRVDVELYRNEVYGIYDVDKYGFVNNFWIKEYGDKGCYILSNIYNEVERQYNEMQEKKDFNVKLTQGDLELVLIALSKMDKDREKYVELYNEIISQLNN